jgi:hypothetical protein
MIHAERAGAIVRSTVCLKEGRVGDYLAGAVGLLLVK